MRTRRRTALPLAAALLGAVVLPVVSAAQTPAAPPQVPVTVGTVGGDVTVLADSLEEVGPDHLLVATGNADSTTAFDYANAVIRLSPDLQVLDYWASANWAALRKCR